MTERLGPGAYGKFILLGALSKVLLMDRSYLALGGGGFMLPLVLGAVLLGVLWLLNRRREPLFSPVDEMDRLGRAALGLVVLGILCEIGSLAGGAAMNMKYETFLTAQERDLGAAALGAMAVTAAFGFVGMEGAGKIGLILVLPLLTLVLIAGYSNYDTFRILPLFIENGEAYVRPALEWLMAFWPMILIGFTPREKWLKKETVKSGFRGVGYGAVWCGVIWLACILVRSPLAAQTGYSPVGFLFEQATMSRAFYRLDPLLSIAIGAVVIVTGGLGLHVCALLLQKMFDLKHVRPILGLLTAFLLMVLYWVLSPGSPGWGLLGTIRTAAPCLVLAGVALRGIPIRRRGHER